MVVKEVLTYSMNYTNIGDEWDDIACVLTKINAYKFENRTRAPLCYSFTNGVPSKLIISLPSNINYSKQNSMYGMVLKPIQDEIRIIDREIDPSQHKKKF